MKKVLVIILIIGAITWLDKKEEQVIIPEEAIRFRVIANSNEEKDQDLKKIVKNTIQDQMSEDIVPVDNIIDARNKIKKHIPDYEDTVEKTLTANQSTLPYKINYGLNYFPEKNYKGVKYQEGYYESLVVTLGNGMGNNWWCVLFPPLCLLEAEESDQEEVEYKFFIKEIIDKYF